MEQATSLQKLTDAADLLSMVEALLATSSAVALTPAIMSGIRHTIKNSRDMMLTSHDAIASSLLARSRVQNQAAPANPIINQTMSDDQNRIDVRRRDLRASIERMVEPRQSPQSASTSAQNSVTQPDLVR